MSDFAPSGYALVEHVLATVLRHLNPGKLDEDFEKMDAQQGQEVALAAVRKLRSLLFDGKLTAYYNQPIFGGMGKIPSHFWLGDSADGTIVSGRYWPFGPNTSYRDDKPSSPLFFKEGEVEAALTPDIERTAGDEIAKPGRPSKQPQVKAAYWKLYPSGHGKDGQSWKAVANAVSKEIGEQVHEDTVIRAVRGE
ncbi:hypothetical protein [Rhizobium leguminosarum]|uniref:Uncharacterized protein n=1 Tax=Rhizobium leguminosarum TaxID=384 RepID=A0A7K3VHY3_RHILE|nr:hypothetical protein [Rhizobium leguminosarum]NEK15691.1 hypothetical protein [Rhizobium leguminosarum]